MKTVFKFLIELTRKLPGLFVKFRVSSARTVEDVESFSGVKQYRLGV